MRQTVIDTLRDNHTRTIGFTLTGTTGMRIRVSPRDFLTVATAIENGTINVVEGGAPKGKAKYTLTNDGNDVANTLYVGEKDASDNVFKSLLVHESVHAIFDLKRATMPWLDNEVVAYISQGFYVKSAGEDGGLSEQAMLGLEIARAFNEIEEDPFWLENLRGSLLSSPTYHGYIRGEFRGDG